MHPDDPFTSRIIEAARAEWRHRNPERPENTVEHFLYRWGLDGTAAVSLVRAVIRTGLVPSEYRSWCGCRDLSTPHLTGRTMKVSEVPSPVLHGYGRGESGIREDVSCWQENAIRDMEDGRCET